MSVTLTSPFYNSAVHSFIFICWVLIWKTNFIVNFDCVCGFGSLSLMLIPWNEAISRLAQQSSPIYMGTFFSHSYSHWKTTNLVFYFSLDLIYHFLNPKKNSYSNGNSSFHMDEWKVHLAFKTNWLLQVMLWLHFTLGKTFSTLDPRARMWFLCCRRYIAKKKKKCYWSGC